MDRREQYALLVVSAALFLGGLVTVKLKGSASLDPNANPAKGAAKVVNSSLRSAVNITAQPAGLAGAGDWSVPPRWPLVSAGSLRGRHPLYRRPSYIGENRHKVMTEGWDGWFYNPPSEVYF